MGEPTVDLLVPDVSASGGTAPLSDTTGNTGKDRSAAVAAPGEATRMRAEETAVFAIHEAFHEYVQASHDWPASDGSGSRSTLLPADPAPRLLRHRLIKTLRRAWLEPEKRSALLAEARSLLDRYRADHAAEARAIRISDIAEGTAEYAAVAFVARALSDWTSSQEMLRARTLDLIGEGLDASAAADSESYSIGLYAGLLLQEIGRPGWQRRAQAAPLAEVLLETVAPAGGLAPASPEDRDTVTRQVGATNTLFAGRARAVTRAWVSGERFLAFPSEAFAGSVGVELFAATAELPRGLGIELGFSGVAEIGKRTRLLQGDAIAGWIMSCGNGMVALRARALPSDLIPVSAPEHKVDGGGTVICVAGED